MLNRVVGTQNWSRNQETLNPLLTPSTSHKPKGKTYALVTPQSSEQIQHIVTFCAEHKIPITTQGGNTGRCEGALAQHPHGILLSTSKLNNICHIDTTGQTALVEAGVVLDTLNQKLNDHNLFFPIKLGASGSCQIGGNIATNAGGLHALKYGSTRALTLGIEAVMANGELYSHLSPLRKDNRGYAINQLLIGSEGTLGIITKANLKLASKPLETQTYFLASSLVSSLLSLFNTLIQNLEPHICAAEIISFNAIEQAKEAYPHLSFPLPPSPWYLLLEASSTTPNPSLAETMQNLLMDALEHQLISDIIKAQNKEQQSRLWQWREYIVSAPAFFKNKRHFFRSDIAVPIHLLPQLFKKVEAELPLLNPAYKSYPYGHMGDGNIHYNIYTPQNLTTQDFLSQNKQVSSFFRDLVLSLGGTFSAEHGIGSLKMEDLRLSVDPCHWNLLKTIKKAFDPFNIMNPHTIIPETYINPNPSRETFASDQKPNPTQP
jgi:FAD/FMN-containing dehydrogenase